MSDIKIKYVFCNIVIIGGGGAGLSTAIHLSKNIPSIIVVTKNHPLDSTTAISQGGINAVLDEQNDNYKWHAFDTMKGGAWLGNYESIEILSKNSSNAIKSLEKLGVSFDKDQDENIIQKPYGGQTLNYGKGGLAKRVCSVADKTGEVIQKVFFEQVLKNKILILNKHFALDLIIAKNSCIGVLCWDINKGIIKVILANKTIVSTGGYEQIYSMTTASKDCTGDGHGLAIRAGIKLQDMEFIQFHPTVMHNTNKLITEAARAMGGKLLNSNHERFMQNYSPDLMELAPRDIVARAIVNEVLEGRGCGTNKDHILLDITHLTEEEIFKKLPTLWQTCTNLNINPAKIGIPVFPAAHYCIGGIPINKHCQVISINRSKENIIHNLYAIGEASCSSIHGANRLGCNSLLEIVVFSEILANYIIVNKNNFYYQKISQKKINILIDKFKKKFGKGEKLNLNIIRNNIQNINQKYVNVFKSIEGLKYAIHEINDLEQRLKKYKILNNKLINNDELLQFLEIENLIICSKTTILSALRRKESRGSHYINEYPAISELTYHSIINMNNKYEKRIL